MEHSPQHCLVIEGPPLYFEDPQDFLREPTSAGFSLVGFALAAPDVVAWTRDRDELCRSHLRAKYGPVPEVQAPPLENETPAEPDSDEPNMPRKPLASGALNLSPEKFISVRDVA